MMREKEARLALSTRLRATGSFYTYISGDKVQSHSKWNCPHPLVLYPFLCGSFWFMISLVTAPAWSIFPVFILSQLRFVSWPAPVHWILVTINSKATGKAKVTKCHSVIQSSGKLSSGSNIVYFLLPTGVCFFWLCFQGSGGYDYAVWSSW